MRCGGMGAVVGIAVIAGEFGQRPDFLGGDEGQDLAGLAVDRLLQADCAAVLAQASEVSGVGSTQTPFQPWSLSRKQLLLGSTPSKATISAKRPLRRPLHMAKTQRSCSICELVGIS